MPKVDIGDAEIYYEETGSGDPVMFVPGLGGGAAVWGQQIPHFSKYYRCIAHDHRGCGQSTYSVMDYSVDQMAADGHADVVDRLAFPLPFDVIAEMLGMPEADIAALRDGGAFG